MKALPLLGLAAALLLPFPARADQERTFLLSIAGIELAGNEYVDGFAIDTWGVEVLAVCRLPPGWEIRAGKQASPDGVIAGEASHGVTFLNRGRLGELRGLALVRLQAPVVRSRQGNMPPTFSGRARIGRYGTDVRGREQVLTAANVGLAPATRCPDPSAR